MIDPDSIPAASCGPEEHADWLELAAARHPDHRYSRRAFISDLNISSTTDGLLEEKESEDDSRDSAYQIEAIVDDAFSEMDDRLRACGGDSSVYPFVFGEDGLELHPESADNVYTFLLLLSAYGKDAGPKGSCGAKLFEEVSAQAAASYFGGRSRVFGFPRTDYPKGFADAVDSLCRDMGEGEGCKRTRQELPHQKDAKLDVVAWRDFPDRRVGKMIAFGQCATTEDWGEKVLELPDPHSWCSHWMMDQPIAPPARMFFLPHRIDRGEWAWASRRGGVLFDRCRIAHFAREIDGDLKERLSAWSAHVLEAKVWR